MSTDPMAHAFEAERGRLEAMAVRMLGSRAEAEDAVQEAWLRLGRTDADSIENLGGWLTTVVSRVCLDRLRRRRVRGEQPLDATLAETALRDDALDPEQEVLLADSVGLALMVVLERMSPPERVSFVLHDLFDIPFDEIAPIVGRTPTATRKLASRARGKVKGARPSGEGDTERRRRLVSAFLAASREGDLERLINLLDPDAVLRADEAAVAFGADAEVRGASSVADVFRGRARAAQVASLDDAPGLIWAPGGTVRVAFLFTFAADSITAIEMVAEPDRLAAMDVVR